MQRKMIVIIACGVAGLIHATAAAQTCAVKNSLGCWAGCVCDEIDAACTTPVTPGGIDLITEETNFVPIDLALVQASGVCKNDKTKTCALDPDCQTCVGGTHDGEWCVVDEVNDPCITAVTPGTCTGTHTCIPAKINRFQEAVEDILAKQDPPPVIVPVYTVQNAIKGITNNPGLNVVIFGHGSPGHFKVGQDDLADQDVKAKFVAGVKGLVKSLTLYGCEVSQGTEGQEFLKKLTRELQRPVHTWDGKVYAFGNDAVIPAKMQNRFYIEDNTDKKEIPTVSEWGLAVMCLLVLTAGTVVVIRRRAMVVA